ncbi:uncharacterized protein LOC135842666 [Planococcus citri]|uniref:uncharacterized protein LOC135842666 n=1 Tax=Planococcus citri TaxID=170843 RepID=UPI0031F926C8
MNVVIIVYILCLSSVKVISKKALLFNTDNETLEDFCHENDDGILPYLAACPAFTHQEKQFNKDVSLTQQSIFSRLIFAKNESPKNTVLDFCEEPFKPVMLYDKCEKQYEIGYELYFNDGEISQKWYSTCMKDTYYCLISVNTKKHKNKVENRTIANTTTTSEFKDRHDDDMNVKFHFMNGSRTLVFYWIKVLSVRRSKPNKRVNFEYYRQSSLEGYNKFTNLQDKCENYQLNDDDLYLKKNQKKLLKDILVPPSLFEGNADLSCGQPYGCLTPSQIIPLWFFSKNSARLASCSHMNLIPVWKSIADNNLKKVDLFIVATYKSIKCDVVFGTSGVLEMKTSSASNETQEMYLSTAKGDRMAAIPKIIYRVVRVDLKWQYPDEYIYAYAVIIIHNDPTAVPDTDRLCNKSDAPTGWQKIINDDPRTGLTYVCPMTEALNNKSGAYDSIPKYEIHPLNLNAVGYINYTRRGGYRVNEAEKINSYFEYLLRNDSSNLDTVSYVNCTKGVD